VRLHHPGEPLLQAAEAKGEAGLIDAEEVQEGGVEVADVHGVLDYVVGVVVGVTVALAEGAEGVVDADGPDPLVASELFKTQRGVGGIGL